MYRIGEQGEDRTLESTTYNGSVDEESGGATYTGETTVECYVMETEGD